MNFNSQFAEYVIELPLLTERLRSSKPLTPDEIRSSKQPGIYSFSERGQVLYIGRTRNFRNRFKNHCDANSRENTAAFAFLIARSMTGKTRASYKKEGGRKSLMQDPIFYEQFQAAKQRIRQMEIRFVPVDDHNLQHLLELYASLEFNSVHNNFSTS